MKAPQIIMIVLIAMNVTIHLVHHGEERTDHYNFFLQLFAKAMLVALLWWGGFFG